MVAPAKEPVPSDDRMVELYQQIAQAVSIPIVLQDHPASADVHMPAALIARILIGSVDRLCQGRGGADGAQDSSAA